MGYCHPCAEPLADTELLDHIRLLHPDDQPEHWPDGSPVIHEDPELWASP